MIESGGWLDSNLTAAMKPSRNSIVIAMILVSGVVIWGIVQTNNKDVYNVTEVEVGSDGDQVLDAIFVLMGGQTEDGGVPLWVQRRLDRAVELQRERRTGGGGLPPIVSVSAHSPLKHPNLTEDGFIWFESNSAAEYLHKVHGVDFGLLQKECTSYDTEGNGYFSLVQFAMPAGWRHIAIITSEFHMRRSEAIFEWIYGLPGAGAGLHSVPFTKRFLPGSKSQGFVLEYHSVSDKNLEAAALESRKSAEKKYLENVKLLSKRIRTLPALHDYIYLEKKLYNAANVYEFGKQSLQPNAPGLY